jgi:hypothetical protein
MSMTSMTSVESTRGGPVGPAGVADTNCGASRRSLFDGCDRRSALPTLLAVAAVLDLAGVVWLLR